MNLVIVDHGSGNLRSAEKAFLRAATRAGHTISIAVSGDADVVRKADRVVLPGVGAFGHCRANIDARPGLRAALDEVVIDRGRPFLGICVGMQLMATHGFEHGMHRGLDWIPGEVIELDVTSAVWFNSRRLRVPHMGWNELRVAAPHPLLENLAGGAHMYFVHSYHMRCAAAGDVLATTDYGGAVTAVIGRDNLVGVQFHPEKSQAEGLRLIDNFLRWRP